MTSSLVDRVVVLRDEVLETAERAEPRGVEVFDAIVRRLTAPAGTTAGAGMDLTLHDALARRLAWGEAEDEVLADSRDVCERLLAATQRSLRDPLEELFVAEAVADVACSTARIIAMAAVDRATSERTALLQEERMARRLKEALDVQKQELARYNTPPTRE